MARSVLKFVRPWVATLVLLAGPWAAAAAEEQGCSPVPPSPLPAVAEPGVRTIQQQVKAGPFYKQLLLQFGEPLSCNVASDDGTIRLTFAFRRRAQLIVQVDPKLELSDQKISIPRMEMMKALALLKAAERNIYRPIGCGIRWTAPRKDHPPARQVFMRWCIAEQCATVRLASPREEITLWR